MVLQEHTASELSVVYLSWKLLLDVVQSANDIAIGSNVRFLLQGHEDGNCC
jgi:hypothetical protein